MNRDVMTMNIYSHGDIFQTPEPPFVSKQRFVALVDVLGMKNWLNRAAPASIAAEVGAIGPHTIDQASSGQRLDSGQASHWGPLVGTTHFSDTIFAWTYDDSWASLSLLCNAMKTVMGVAAMKSIPLRGAISFGEMVCDAPRLRFVGQPLANAHIWESKECPYKGIGISLTPLALEYIMAKAVSEPIHAMCRNDFGAEAFADPLYSGPLFCWNEGICFVAHWATAAFAGREARGIARIESILDRPEIRPDTEVGRGKAADARAQTISFYRNYLARRDDMLRRKRSRPDWPEMEAEAMKQMQGGLREAALEIRRLEDLRLKEATS